MRRGLGRRLFVAIMQAPDGALKLPGEGSGVYRIFSPAEVKALKADCPRLMPLLKKQT